VNHKISKEIVNIAKEEKAIINLEELKNIRERIKYSKKMNKRLHNWNFYQLQTFIEYKANAEGLEVVYVKPNYTSQMCSACEHIDKRNRPNQSTFKCKACGYEANADYNTSVNIANVL
ncbi:RNA-guided endonuclease TnpB family protein, partial [Paramaledivibacter caminithermalis]